MTTDAARRLEEYLEWQAAQPTPARDGVGMPSQPSSQPSSQQRCQSTATRRAAQRRFDDVGLPRMLVTVEIAIGGAA